MKLNKFFLFYLLVLIACKAKAGNPDIIKTVGSPSILTINSHDENGISRNSFTRFEPVGKIQVIDPGISPDDKSTKTIVIESSDINLSETVLENVSPHPTNLILLSNGQNDEIVCNKCSFKGFQRVTIAAASTVPSENQNKPYKSFKTDTNGSIKIIGFNTLLPMLVNGVTLEFISSNIENSGFISTNSKANSHPSGGYVVSENGKYTVASAGINFYLGSLEVSYENGEILSTLKDQDYSGKPSIFNASLSSASIAIISARSLKFSPTSSLSTISDIVMDGDYDGQQYIPHESISISTLVNSDKFGDIHQEGQFLTSNLVGIIAANNFYNNGLIVAKNSQIAVSKLYTNDGLIESSETLEASANSILNFGQISGRKIAFNATHSIKNQFGGVLLASDISLEAGDLVINGSRNQEKSYDSNYSPLNVPSIDFTGVDYGVYNNNAYTHEYDPDINTSASIIGNNIFIKTKYLENINPYFRTRPTTERWNDLIDFDYEISRQVRLTAEQQLQIKANNYVVNSSAILGVEQQGELTVNSPKFINERYRVNTDGYKFSRKKQDSLKETHSSTGTTYEAHVNNFSPMGILYSYGDFNFSPVTSSSKASFLNHISYLQVHGISNLYNTEFLSLSMATGTLPSGNMTSAVCLTQQCNQSKLYDSVIRTTFTSFLGNVYGLSTNFETNTTVQVEAHQQALVDAYIKDYIERNTKTIFDQPSGSQWFNSEIITMQNKDKLLVITEYYCFDYYNYKDNAPDRTCNTTDHSIYVSTIIAEDADGKIIPGTEQTHNQLLKMAQIYLDGFTFKDKKTVYAGMKDGERQYVQADGYVIKKVVGYTVENTPNITLYYIENFYDHYHSSIPYITFTGSEPRTEEVTLPYATFKETKPKAVTGLTHSYNRETGALELKWEENYYKMGTYMLNFQIGTTTSGEADKGSVTTHNMTVKKDSELKFKVRSCAAYIDTEGNNQKLCGDLPSTWSNFNVDYKDPDPVCGYECKPPPCEFC